MYLSDHYTDEEAKTERSELLKVLDLVYGKAQHGACHIVEAQLIIAACSRCSTVSKEEQVAERQEEAVSTFTASSC